MQTRISYTWRTMSALDEALSEAARTAAAAWPELRVDEADFCSHLEGLLTDTDPLGSLSRLHVADLFLAFACLKGDPRAWKTFERVHLSRIPLFIGHVDRTPAFADDVRQRLSEKLIGSGPSEGPAKLALYTGRGPLEGWLRIAAKREALNAKRGRKSSGEPSEGFVAPGLDPEMQLLKHRYAKEFNIAFRAMLAELSADERSVLKLHYLDGLTLDEVGKAYGVHRATAARWLASAREKIVEGVHVQLRAKLGKSAPRGASLMNLVKSQLDVSIRKELT